MSNLYKSVLASLIYWFSDSNYGRHKTSFDTEEQRNEHSVLLKDGWWETAPVSVVKCTPERSKEAIRLLTEKWESLKASQVNTVFKVDGKEVTLTPSEILRTFEEHFVLKGKIIAPEYDAIFGFQRGASILGALALRFKLGIAGDFKIPVIVKEMNELERVQACVIENTGKMAGTRLIDSHWPSLVKCAVSLREASMKAGKGFKEIETIKAISAGAEGSKRGTGQKAHYIAVLDSRFPSLKIAERLFSEAKSNPDEGVFYGQELGKALDRNVLQVLEMGTRTPLPEKATAKTEADVAAYFDNPKDDSKRAPVAAKRSDAVNFVNNTDSVLLKFIINAVYSNNLGSLAKLLAYSKELNEVAAKAGIKVEEIGK